MLLKCNFRVVLLQHVSPFELFSEYGDWLNTFALIIVIYEIDLALKNCYFLTSLLQKIGHAFCLKMDTLIVTWTYQMATGNSVHVTPSSNDNISMQRFESRVTMQKGGNSFPFKDLNAHFGLDFENTNSTFVHNTPSVAVKEAEAVEARPLADSEKKRSRFSRPGASGLTKNHQLAFL